MANNTPLVNTLEYNQDLCIGCKMCIMVCPHEVFSMNSKVVHIVRYEACMECGACQLNCPTGAIIVESGVGCASAMIKAALTGREEAICGPDCDSEEQACC